MIVSCGIESDRQSPPSSRTYSPPRPFESFLCTLRAARFAAREIFIRSITAGQTRATAYSISGREASTENHSSRFFAESFLESRIPAKRRFAVFALRIFTPATTTGPAKGPRPASSIPTIALRYLAMRINLLQRAPLYILKYTFNANYKR